mmetsp:Transcript_15311/g.37553  ORF Transcript_15311/g.37553 Transcript_15311/m.37553 type:complete len:363 (+) Transcript_15311:994-2082(+)
MVANEDGLRVAPGEAEGAEDLRLRHLGPLVYDDEAAPAQQDVHFLRFAPDAGGADDIGLQKDLTRSVLPGLPDGRQLEALSPPLLLPLPSLLSPPLQLGLGHRLGLEKLRVPLDLRLECDVCQVRVDAARSAHADDAEEGPVAAALLPGPRERQEPECELVDGHVRARGRQGGAASYEPLLPRPNERDDGCGLSSSWWSLYEAEIVAQAPLDRLDLAVVEFALAARLLMDEALHPLVGPEAVLEGDPTPALALARGGCVLAAVVAVDDQPLQPLRAQVLLLAEIVEGSLAPAVRDLVRGQVEPPPQGLEPALPPLRELLAKGDLEVLFGRVDEGDQSFLGVLVAGLLPSLCISVPLPFVPVA